MPQTKLWAIVPAAGSGSRFSKTDLKQYQSLGEKTVLEHTVNRLNDLPLAGCVLAISPQDNVAKTLAFEHSERMHFCHGGAERVNSVLNALDYLSQFATDDDYVLVHDAARPSVTSQNLHDLVQYCLTQKRAAILAIPVRDTLKNAVNQHIIKTISREDIWQAQTPQMAKLGDLRQAITCALAQKLLITDEASALESAGIAVDVVLGRADNIKITYAEDLELTKLILTAQSTKTI